MNFDRLDGRIAALELLAGLGLQLYFRARFGADYRGKVREEMDRILADLEAGELSAPTNPMARDEMRHTIRQILLKIAAEEPRQKNGD